MASDVPSGASPKPVAGFVFESQIFWRRFVGSVLVGWLHKQAGRGVFTFEANELPADSG
jgi:hypothetical protein